MPMKIFKSKDTEIYEAEGWKFLKIWSVKFEKFGLWKFLKSATEFLKPWENQGLWKIFEKPDAPVKVSKSGL